MALIGARRALIKPKNAASSSFSLTYQSSIGSSSTGPTVNYGTMSYGSNSTRVVALVTWPQTTGETISSITVNGVSFSQVAGTFKSVGAAVGASDIWISNSAISGTSGAASVTFSATLGSTAGTGIALYNLQTATPAVSGTANGSAFNTTTASATVVVPAGGIAIGITASWGFTGGDPTFTAGATADQDFTIGPFNIHVLVGHTTTTGSVGVTATYPANSAAPLSLASWGP